MGHNVAELEIQIKKTAFPEIWMSKTKVICRLIDYLEALGEKTKEIAFPEVWMNNPRIVKSLVQFFEKKVADRDWDVHLLDMPLEIYFVFYGEISSATLQSIRNHLKSCKTKTCLLKIEKEYKKNMWGDPEQTKDAVDRIKQLAKEIAADFKAKK